MNGLRKMTSGLPTFPILVMFGLFFFDEWDTAAFNVLAPNIQHAFHLSDRGFGFLVISNLSIVLLAAVPLGYYGDRLPRVRLVTIGAVIAGVFSLLTGLAGTLLFLVLIRLGNGMGRLVNDPIHSSLLSDYYLPEDRPAIYGIHRPGTAYRMDEIPIPLKGFLRTDYPTDREILEQITARLGGASPAAL